MLKREELFLVDSRKRSLIIVRKKFYISGVGVETELLGYRIVKLNVL